MNTYDGRPDDDAMQARMRRDRTPAVRTAILTWPRYRVTCWATLPTDTPGGPCVTVYYRRRDGRICGAPMPAARVALEFPGRTLTL